MGPWNEDVLSTPQTRAERETGSDMPVASVKPAGRLIKHARYYWLLLAEGHLTRRLFTGMVRRIDLLPLPAG